MRLFLSKLDFAGCGKHNRWQIEEVLMSCYLHRLKDLLDEAGIEVKAGNRKQIDQAIHQIVGVAYKNCPTAWEQVKERLENEDKRRAFVQQLQNAIK